MAQSAYSLSDNTKKNIARNLELSSFSDVIDMEALSLDQHIERKIGKKLKPSITIGHLIVRGSLYTFFGRLLSREWIDKQMKSCADSGTL